MPSSRSSAPSTPWLAAGFLLAGLGTAILGPVLPYVAKMWHLSDANSGSLFFFKFVGAFLGGVAVASHLRRSITLGSLLCCVGFGGFAVAPHAWLGAIALLVGGFGLGQIIAATNIVAGQRYTRHTGSALATLNFFWALGAVATGLLAAALLPRYGLRAPVLLFAALFAVNAVGGWISSTTSGTTSEEAPAASIALPTREFIVFASLLLLYGGLETCLTSWLTTFALRFSDAHVLGGQSAVVLFWASLTVGRLCAGALLRFVSERFMQLASVFLAFFMIVTLSLTQHAWMLSALCIALGLTLAAYFPAIFGMLLQKSPPPRVAGIVLASSGLGAAGFPWLMGVVSTATHSLRKGMLVPAGVALVMLVIGALWLPTQKPTGEAEANVVSS
ncbi:MFS transporter [Granulicella cerasi]|uniref:MFS transporter n=1 Tax=Granulicella cerasi TaxID=741063 RepID=A0ABW1Z3R1_9BACT|nr:MFS transporter [Granulicella cerasi]